MTDNNNLSIVRQPISDAALHTLVDTVIEGFFATYTKFTAFSVTQTLRQQYPLIEIEHSRVRGRVHDMMFNSHFNTRPFNVQTEIWDGKQALTYTPFDPAIPRPQLIAQMATDKQTDHGAIVAVTGITIAWPSDDDDDEDEADDFDDYEDVF